MLPKAAVAFSLLLLCAPAAAVQVAFVVEYPDGTTFSDCLTLEEDADGYAVLEESGLGLNWSTSELYGHGLCAIEDVGCSADNCWCTDKYWGFYVKGVGEENWTYSAVGFDGGSSCAEHYCAKDGDVLGFAYGPYGTKPAEKTFEEVCGRKNGDHPEEEAGGGLGLILIAGVLLLAAAPYAFAYFTYPGKKT